MKNCRLFNGDCFDLFSKLKDNSIDMVMVDPPYGTTVCKWDSVIPLEPMWKELRRVAKDDGAILIMAGQPFTSVLVMSNIKEFKYCWVWHKNRPTGGATCKQQPMKCVEDVCVFYSKPPVYNPIRVDRSEDELKRLSRNSLTKCDSVLYGANGYVQERDKLKKKYPTNYLSHKTVFSRSSEKVLHPTQKPVALMEYLIRTYTEVGDVVLDFAMGSGTTGVACVNLGRRFVGGDSDMEFGYFGIAKARIRAAIKKREASFGMNE